MRRVAGGPATECNGFHARDALHSQSCIMGFALLWSNCRRETGTSLCPERKQRAAVTGIVALVGKNPVSDRGVFLWIAQRDRGAERIADPTRADIGHAPTPVVIVPQRPIRAGWNDESLALRRFQTVRTPRGKPQAPGPIVAPTTAPPAEPRPWRRHATPRRAARAHRAAESATPATNCDVRRIGRTHDHRVIRKVARDFRVAGLRPRRAA